MSEQQRDIVYYCGEDYTLITKRGDGLYVLPKQKLQSQYFISACSNGYFCEYEISEDSTLYLRQLNMLFAAEELEIDGVRGRYIEGIDESELTFKEKFERYLGVNISPEMEKREKYGGMYIFQDICMKMEQYNGTLLIGNNMDWKYYVRGIGFQKAWAYNQVYQLHFKDGKIIKKVDLSECVERLRKILCVMSEDMAEQEFMKKLGCWDEAISNNEFKFTWEYVPWRKEWYL